MQKLNKKILKEEKFLIEILFSQRKSLYKAIDLKIDFDLLVKIASSHLMLPALFINLKKKKLINSIPSELKIYLKEIYSLNKERNEAAIGEIKEISNKLIDNNINHVFLKGSSHLLNGIYSDIGERMIGDIDILVSKEDFEKSIEILVKENYYSSKPMTSYAKHYGRLINNDKLFAVEIHKKLLIKKYNKLLNQAQILGRKIFFEQKIYILNLSDKFIYNIYNYMINDHGSLKLCYSYRSYYDNYLIFKKIKQKPTLKYDKHFINYFMIAEQLNITNLKLLKIKTQKSTAFRFNVKYSNKFYFVIDNYMCDMYLGLLLKKYQFAEFILNKNFREYVLKKLYKK